MLPKKFMYFTVSDMEDGQFIPLSAYSLRVNLNGVVFVDKFAQELLNLPEWIIEYKDGKYLLYSTPNSQKIKIAKINDEMSYIPVEYVGENEKMYDKLFYSNTR